MKYDADDDREPKEDTPEDAGTPGTPIWFPDVETPEPSDDDTQDDDKEMKIKSVILFIIIILLSCNDIKQKVTHKQVDKEMREQNNKEKRGKE